MKKVLVTAIGSFSADVTIKELKKHNFYVVGCDIYPKEWIVNSNDVDKFYQVPKVFETDKFRNKILDICNENDIDYIVPLIDVEVDFFSVNRADFSNQTICISDSDTLELCRDKFKFQNFIKELTYINGIETTMLKDIEPNKLNYPVVCKKIDGRSSEGLKYIYNCDELKLFMKEASEDYCIEPYIEGNVVTVDIIRDKNGKTFAMPREELIRTKNGAGLSVYVYNDANLSNICVKLANDLKITGCVNFEFIKASDGYHIIECNPRFSGGIAFSCITGYSFVINHINSFESEIDDMKPYNNQYIAKRYSEYVMKVENDGDK